METKGKVWRPLRRQNESHVPESYGNVMSLFFPISVLSVTELNRLMNEAE